MQNQPKILTSLLVAAAISLTAPLAFAQEVITTEPAPVVTTVEPAPVVVQPTIQQQQTTTTTTTRKLTHDEKERLEKEEKLQRKANKAEREYQEKVRHAEKEYRKDVVDDD